MWAQGTPVDPTQWAPYGLGATATALAWFLWALAAGRLRWGRDCERETDFWRERALKAEAERDEALHTERQLRESTEKKLERALEVLSATTAAVRRK